MNKIWLVPHPTSQFNEDVKDLAVKNGLRIMDAKFKGTFNEKYVEDKPPVLTLKKGAKKAAKKEEK